MRVQDGSSASLAEDSWGDLGRTFKGLRPWVGELSDWYRTSCDEYCGHYNGHHTVRFVDNLLGCYCPRLGVRLKDGRIRKALTSMHLRELKNVEQSTHKSKSFRSKGCPERCPFSAQILGSSANP